MGGDHLLFEGGVWKKCYVVALSGSGGCGDVFFFAFVSTNHPPKEVGFCPSMSPKKGRICQNDDRKNGRTSKSGGDEKKDFIICT